MNATHAPEFGRSQWALLLTLIAGMTASAGPAMTVIGGISLIALGKEFGWSKTSVSLGVTIFFLFFAIGIPVVGALIRRFTARTVVIAFAFGFPLCIAALALNPGNYPLLLVNMAVLGAIGAGASGYAYLSILPQWFARRLGSALGIAMIGLGIGQVLLPLLVEFVNRTEGWRATFIGLAVFNALLSLPALLLFYRSPKAVEVGHPVRSDVGIALNRACRTPTFSILAIAFFLISAAVIASVIYLIPAIQEKGFTSAQAAQVASLTGIALLLSRPLAGAALDVFSPVTVGVVSGALGILGLVMLMQAASLPILLVGAFLLGCCYGAETDIMVIMVRRYFGDADFPRIYGVFGMVYTFGPVLGPLMLGVLRDVSGTYALGLFAAIVMLAVATLLLVSLSRTSRPLQREMERQQVTRAGASI